MIEFPISVQLRWRRRLAGPLVLLLAILIMLVGYVLRYGAWVRSLTAHDVALQDGFANEQFPLLDQHQITQLGMVHRPGFQPDSSYTLHDGQKPKGVTRIGIFGCSFVKGSEAASGQDFPSQLQRLFERDGCDRIEVLNFGVGAFGVQQSYLLWQYLAQSFDLDVTIYDLYGFHRERDNTFIMLDTMYAPVHARHVLEGDGLRLIEVTGADRRDAAARYFSLRPAWEYLRFDTKAPPQIRALLPKGRDLKINPFYYRSDTHAEVAEIYRRIFADIGAKSKSFLVLVNDDNSESLLAVAGGERAFSSVRTSSEEYTWRRSGLFRAPKNHPSALGYNVLAQETKGILSGSSSVAVPEFEIVSSPSQGGFSQRSTDLSSFAQVYLTMAGHPAGVFVKTLDDRNVTPYSFGSHGATALLDVSGTKNPLFIASRKPIPPGELWLEFSMRGRPIHVEIGQVATFDGGFVGVADSQWKTVKGEGWSLFARREVGATAVEISSDDRVEDVRLGVGEMALLRGDVTPSRFGKRHQLIWKPALGDLITTRGHPAQEADSLLEDDFGDYCVTASTSDGRADTWCTRRWLLSTATIQLGTIDPQPDRPLLPRTRTRARYHNLTFSKARDHGIDHLSLPHRSANGRSRLLSFRRNPPTSARRRTVNSDYP